MKYAVLIYWSDADDAFIAEMPELPGCMADGETKEAALAMVEQVASEWIEVATEAGLPIPEPSARLMFA